MEKILVLNYEFPPLGGGAGHVSYEIASWYVRKGCKVDVVTMGFAGLPEREEKNGVNIIRVKSIRKRMETCSTFEMQSYVFSAIAFLRKQKEIEGYNIVHCHFLIPTGLVALYLKRKFNLDYIVTIHGSDVPGYNPDRFKLEHLFTKRMLSRICQKAEAICSPSIYLKNLLISNVGCQDVLHIPNGIDLDNFKLDLSKPKENIILSTGRLLERKGFQTLINAVKDVTLPFDVHIVGDGPYRQYLENLAEGSKTRIIFHGWIERGSMELRCLYEKAAIYVLASSQENASISLLEGMAAGCVMISTNISGCPESIGNAGYLIDVGDDQALRNIFFELSNEKEKLAEYSKRSRDRLMNEFLWEYSVQKYLEALRIACM